MQLQTPTLPPRTKAIPQPAIVRNRVQAIDLWRGIVMIIMALDHTRVLMTARPTVLFRAIAERLKSWLLTAVSVFGRVPVFYYILHIILIHIIAWIIFQGYSMLYADIRYVPSILKGIGVSLSCAYVIWISAILILYWPCKWYNTYKINHSHWWLSYL